MLQSLLTPWRLKWYSISILCALLTGFTIATLSGSGSIIWGGRLGGDYPTFYSIGRIISKGYWNELYDQQRQIAEQKPFMGNESTYLPFGYPPHVALVYWPFSLLSYRLSYIIHTGIMILGLLLTLQLIRPMNILVDQHFMPAAALSISFYPIFRAITGGQNTVITMLLIASAWRALEKNREYLAGIFTGLMLYKPQFAIPLIGVYILSGRRRIVLGSGFIALCIYSVGFLMMGSDWLVIWLKNASWQIQAYADLDKENAISLLGFTEAIIGVGEPWALMIGYTLTLMTAVGISLLWCNSKMKRNSTALIGITSTCLVLIPPHVIFYDAGLLLFAYVAIAAHPLKMKAEIFGIIWLMSWSQIIDSFIGFSTIFFVTLGTCILSFFTLVLPILKKRIDGLP